MGRWIWKTVTRTLLCFWLDPSDDEAIEKASENRTATRQDSDSKPAVKKKRKQVCKLTNYLAQQWLCIGKHNVLFSSKGTVFFTLSDLFSFWGFFLIMLPYLEVITFVYISARTSHLFCVSSDCQACPTKWLSSGTSLDGATEYPPLQFFPFPCTHEVWKGIFTCYTDYLPKHVPSSRSKWKRILGIHGLVFSSPCTAKTFI